MPLSDVVVNISYTLTPLTRKEFNRPLILVSDTREGVPVGEFRIYDSPELVAKDYGTNCLAYYMANAIFSQRMRPSDVAILNVGAYTTPSDWTDALDDALNAGHVGWYYLVLGSYDDDVRAAVVEWISGQRRMLVFGNADTETVSEFINKVTSNYQSDRAVACYHAANQATKSYLEAALVGWIGGRYPATAAWFHAKVSGVQPNPASYSDIVQLEQNNIVSWWKTPVGIWVTSCGKTTSGEWADIVVAIDFIEARLKERIWSLLVDRDRIPYTQEGLDLLVHAVTAELHSLARLPYNIIATDSAGKPMVYVYPLRREEIDPLEVRNRRVPDLRFEATVAGAVKTVVVNGLITEEVVPPPVGF